MVRKVLFLAAPLVRSQSWAGIESSLALQKQLQIPPQESREAEKSSAMSSIGFFFQKTDFPFILNLLLA